MGKDVELKRCNLFSSHFLKDRNTHTEREMGSHWFTCQMPVAAGAGQGWEPEIQPRSPTEVAGPLVLEEAPVASQAHVSGKLALRVESGVDPRHCTVGLCSSQAADSQLPVPTPHFNCFF